jgi:hypothetical protein
LQTQGCALSHEGLSDPEDPGPMRSGESGVDAGESFGESSSGACGANHSFSVEVMAAEGSAGSCTGSFDGFLSGIAPIPEGSDLRRSEGMELTLSTCPPDADCRSATRCRVRIRGLGPRGLGAEPAGDLRTLGAVGLETTGVIADGFVDLRSPSPCEDEFCTPRTWFHARSGNPAAPPEVQVPGAPPAEFTFDLGSRTCSPDSGAECGVAEHRVEVAPGPVYPEPGPDLQPMSVAVGETTRVGESGRWMHVATSTNDTCTDEGPRAGWLLWLDFIEG